MSDTTARRVAAVIEDLFGVPAAALGDDVALADGLQLDSLSLVELTVALEDTLGIRFPDDQQGDVTTFGQLVDAVREAADDQAQSA